MDSVSKLMSAWRQERPDLDPSSVAVIARISRLGMLMTRRSEQWLVPMGLTWESFSLIVTLRRAGEPYQLRPSELLHDSLLTSGAMTNRIDRVEAMGLVERLRDPYDRRGVIVKLTPQGLALADQAIATHFERLDEQLASLSRAERKTMAELLSKLLQNLEQADEPAPVGLPPATTSKARRAARRSRPGP